jgi:hypothetical protein
MTITWVAEFLMFVVGIEMILLLVWASMVSPLSNQPTAKPVIVM